jgi:hypothetical protein
MARKPVQLSFRSKKELIDAGIDLAKAKCAPHGYQPKTVRFRNLPTQIDPYSRSPNTVKDRVISILEFDSFREFMSLSRDVRSLSKENLRHGADARDVADRMWQGWDDDYNNDWMGGSHHEAMTSQTWAEGLDLLDGVKMDLSTTLRGCESVKRTRFWDIEGDDCDVSKAAVGIMECFQNRRRRRVSRSGRILRLTVDMTANADFSQEELKWTGIAVIASLLRLEQAGYRCEVFAHFASRRVRYDSRDNSPYDRLVTIVPLKKAEQVVDVETLMWGLVHPLCFRFLAFNAKLSLPVEVDGGMGCATTTPEGLQGDIHFVKTRTRDESIKQAQNGLDKIEQVGTYLSASA